MSVEYHDLFESPRWISDCCGAQGYIGLSSPEKDFYALSRLSWWKRFWFYFIGKKIEMRVGVCSTCKDHACFHKEEDGEFLF